LGCKCGAADLKEHPFYKNLKFPLLRNMDPPIIPVIKNAVDTSYFRKFKEDEIEEEEESKTEIKDETKEDPFKEFGFQGTGNKSILDNNDVGTQK
jgi:protein-serine/threonine kinase